MKDDLQECGAGLVKKNIFEHVRAMLDREHHMRDGRCHFGFTPDDHFGGQYQALHPVTGVGHLAHPGKVQQPLPC